MSIPPPFLISNNRYRPPLYNNTTRMPMVPFTNSGTQFSNSYNNDYQFSQQNTNANARFPTRSSYPGPYNVNQHPVPNASMHISTDSYHTSKSNPELIPSALNRNFPPRQPFINNIPIPQSNMVNRLHNFPPHSPVAPPCFLNQERVNVPNIHVQSPLRPRSEVPVRQNQSENTALQHSQISLNNASFSPLMSTSNPNFSFHTPTVSFPNSQSVTLNCQNFTNNVHQGQNASMNPFPQIPKSPVTGAGNSLTMTANTNNLVTLPGRIDTSTTMFSNYENNLLHSALPVSIQVPPPPIPSIPLHLPPPLPKFDNPLNVPALYSSNSVCEKQVKLDTFIKKFVKMNKKSNNIKIPEFRCILTAGFSISKLLLQAKQDLTNLLQSNEDTWNSEMQKISDLQNKLSEICALLSSPAHMNCLKKKLQIVKKKREQKKKTKRNNLSAKLKAEENRKKRHQEIDKWFDDLKEKNLKLKREAEMKKEADFILLEVRKKIHEAKRTIEKLQVFEKLRSVRQANAVQKGLHIMPDHNTNFENKMSVLKETMLNQLADYEAEERALKVMLETEQEGQLEEETKWKRKKIRALQQKRQKHIVECIFGDSENPLPADPLYLFHNYQMSANSSIESLVQIRHNWDAYLADDGEAIPQQWVIPTPVSNSSWEQWLMNSGCKS